MEKVIYKKSYDCEHASVYNYTMDTIKEWKEKGWILTGTYYQFLTFRRDLVD